MSCGSCGGEIPAGSAACPNCGAAADASAGLPGGDPGGAQWPGPGDQWAGYPGYQSGAAGPHPGYPPARPLPSRTYDLDVLASSLVVMLVITTVTSLIGILFAPILIIMFLLLVPLVVVFLIWFYRARQNAGQLDWRQRWSPPWAVAGWFVPICFLWFPYQIMADIWRAGHLASERTRFPLLPAAWWACWCLAWFTGYRKTTYSSYTFGGVANSTRTFQGSIYSLVFGGTAPSLVFVAAAAVLLAFIIKRVSEGTVGSVGKLAAQAPWQPGAPAPGRH